MRSIVIALLLAACGTPYSARPPLPFKDFPYAWPEKTLELTATAQALGMPVAPRITYVEQNAAGAQTVLLIHGLGSYLKFWRYQIDELAGRGYRVVAIDLPGYGKSDKPSSFPYTMESFAMVVGEVIDQLALGQPVIMGHSMGGHIALTFALERPGVARALVLVSPAGFEAFSARERGWFERAVRSELFLAATEEDIWGSVRGGNFMHWRDDLRWLIEERVRVRTTPEMRAYAYANVMSVRGLTQTEFVRANLGAVATPTLIVYGAADRLIPNPFLHGGRSRDIMEAAHRGIPGSELVGLAGCGHSAQLDCPSQVNAATLSFLGRAAPPR